MNTSGNDVGAILIGPLFIVVGFVVFFSARNIGPNMARMAKSRLFRWQDRFLLSRVHPVLMRCMGLAFVAAGVFTVLTDLRA